MKRLAEQRLQTAYPKTSNIYKNTRGFVSMSDTYPYTQQRKTVTWLETNNTFNFCHNKNTFE